MPKNKFETGQQYHARTTTESGGRPYDVYTARLHQEGTASFTAKVLENTIGNITFGRIQSGSYSIILPQNYDPSKMAVFISDAIDVLIPSSVRIIAYPGTSGSITVKVHDPIADEPYELGGVMASDPVFELRIYS